MGSYWKILRQVFQVLAEVGERYVTDKMQWQSFNSWKILSTNHNISDIEHFG